MNTSIPRIKLILAGKYLQAFIAIASEYRDCGRAGRIGLSTNKKEEKHFKFSDSEFLCVYEAIVRSINGPRYPSRSGNEFQALCELKKYFELEYKKQRNHEIHNL
jgi:hypothetical protein